MFDEADRLILLLRRKPYKEAQILFDERFRPFLWEKQAPEKEVADQKEYEEFLISIG